MAFLSPKQMIDQLFIKKHSTIVDIGAGSGAYVYEACRVNGKAGKIIAVDIDEDKLRLVKDTAKVGGYDIDTLLTDIESKIVLPDYIADYIIFANTLHQIDFDKREKVMLDISRILAPMGEMLFVEWKSGSILGPQKDIIVEREEAEDLFRKSGLSIKKELSAGDYHYAYILIK